MPSDLLGFRTKSRRSRRVVECKDPLAHSERHTSVIVVGVIEAVAVTTVREITLLILEGEDSHEVVAPRELFGDIDPFSLKGEKVFLAQRCWTAWEYGSSGVRWWENRTTVTPLTGPHAGQMLDVMDKGWI